MIPADFVSEYEAREDFFDQLKVYAGEIVVAALLMLWLALSL